MYIDPSTGSPNAYYIPTENRIVVSASIAADKDAILRVYSHHVLARTVEGILWESIESGLADYFAASFTNDPFIGETAAAVFYTGKKDKQLYLRNLDNQIKLGDIINRNSPGAVGQVWGGAFWELRKIIGAEATDKLLFSSWTKFIESDLSAFRGPFGPIEFAEMKAKEKVLGTLFIDMILKEKSLKPDVRVRIANLFQRRGLQG